MANEGSLLVIYKPFLDKMYGTPRFASENPKKRSWFALMYSESN